MYNLLIDELPDEWAGVKIKTDFRQVLKFFRLIENKNIDEMTKAKNVINLFFEDIPPDSDRIWEFIQHYISCGKDDKKDDENTEKVFDFIVDSGRIFSAFYQVYGIDLTVEKIHWFVFLQLLQDLTDDTKFKQVIDIRTKKINKNDSNEYKRELRKLKELYRIDQNNNTPVSMSGFFKSWGRK